MSFNQFDFLSGRSTSAFSSHHFETPMSSNSFCTPFKSVENSMKSMHLTSPTLVSKWHLFRCVVSRKHSWPSSLLKVYCSLARLRSAKMYLLTRRAALTNDVTAPMESTLARACHHDTPNIVSSSTAEAITGP